MGRIVCWFSCGAASAVATKLAIAKYGRVFETSGQPVYPWVRDCRVGNAALGAVFKD